MGKSRVATRGFDELYLRNEAVRVDIDLPEDSSVLQRAGVSRVERQDESGHIVRWAGKQISKTDGSKEERPL